MSLNLYDNLPSKIEYNNTNQKNKNSANSQRFKYLIVLDFEATCAKNRKINPQEIIEWPAIIINTQTNEILSDKPFHFYIKPKHNPKLTAFCTQLTGITQQVMDNIGAQNTIESVTKQWNQWCFENDLLPISKDKPKAGIITCGDWDLKTCWREQKKVSNCCEAALFHSWINIKIIFKRNTYNHYQNYNKYDSQSGLSMMSMLNHLNIKHTGRHHSGIDDVKNICKIVQRLLRNGAVFDYTTKEFGKRSIWNDINIKANLTILKQKQIIEIKEKQKQKHIIDLCKDDNDINNNSNHSNSAEMEWSPQAPSPSPPPQKYLRKQVNDNNEQKIE